MTLASFKATRQPLLGQVFKFFDETLTFDSRTIADDSGADGRIDEIGTVYGAVLFGTPTGTPNASQTGDGTIGSIALAADAQEGDYAVELLSATAFAVFDPSGFRMADGVVATPYDNGQVAFTLTAGGTPFAAGDGFTVSVPKGSGALVPIDFAAVDGTQRFAAIAGERVTVPAAGSVSAKVGLRIAHVTDQKLIWPAGATAAQQAEALSAAASVFIFSRTGV